jgi:DNA repair protein RecN (Recombination protein N)
MLIYLSIENYALIHKLEMQFQKGLSVITGETGAGKSILLGALSLILGNRADNTVLMDKTRKCIVEGIFNIRGYGLEQFFSKNELDYENQTILRREINRHGKSRGFINDIPVTLNILKDLGVRLVNIHSQVQTITLNNSNFQLAVIDNYAGNRNILEKFRKEYYDYQHYKNLLLNLTEKEKQSKADQDYFQFQLDELEKAKLKECEQEEIEKELEILNNAEEIKTTLYDAAQTLMSSDQSIISRLSEINNKLSKLADIHDDIKDIHQRLKSSLIEIDDLANGIEKLEGSIHYDTGNIEELNNRLDTISHLQHKHRVSSISELLQIKKELQLKIQDIISLEDRIKDLDKILAQKHDALLKIASQISSYRIKALTGIEKEVLEMIKGLGMPEAVLKIEHKKLEDITIDGMDKVRFLFNANRGGELKEISRIISGGELSRLMLSIKSMISQKNLLPTIIFDEIDSGVSGDIAGKVGKILQKMSGSMQVIVITHLPQIAGKGKTHFLVYKEIKENKTVSNIKKLTIKDRIEEIAKMLSDENVTSSAVDTARELLNYKTSG